MRNGIAFRLTGVKEGIRFQQSLHKGVESDEIADRST